MLCEQDLPLVFLDFAAALKRERKVGAPSNASQSYAM